ncbi:hypothetical protein [Streptomyces sp. NPDC094049]|uniref:helix-turn-helix transcriptional regulator n=1 Tax=Streptomyces sp. NPDC094049 TaxID=3154987 RepID=UPI0033324052
MVATEPEGETLSEIAARYGRAETTVRNQWTTHPDWPDPLGRGGGQGRPNVYDSTEVDAVVAEHFLRPVVELEASRLYSAAEIEAATGISAGTIRADVSKGRFPQADDKRGAAKVWRGATVTEALAGRHGYRRRGAE